MKNVIIMKIFIKLLLLRVKKIYEQNTLDKIDMKIPKILY